jgi:hypothetical protein
LGSHGTKRLAAGFSGSVETTSYSVNVGKVKTDGVSAINTNIAITNPDKDGYDNTTFDAQVKHAFNADHQLSASLFSTRGGRFNEVSTVSTGVLVNGAFVVSSIQEPNAIGQSQAVPRLPVRVISGGPLSRSAKAKADA